MRKFWASALQRHLCVAKGTTCHSRYNREGSSWRLSRFGDGISTVGQIFPCFEIIANRSAGNENKWNLSKMEILKWFKNDEKLFFIFNIFYSIWFLVIFVNFLKIFSWFNLIKMNSHVIKSTKFVLFELDGDHDASPSSSADDGDQLNGHTSSWATKRRRRRWWAPVRAARWWPPTRSRRRSRRRGRATNVKLSAAQHPPRGCGRWTERRSSGRQRRGGTLVGTWWDLHYLYFEGTWWWDLMVGLVWDLMVGLLSIWAWN